jgi:LCP family protein required for cell wall assembly
VLAALVAVVLVAGAASSGWILWRLRHLHRQPVAGLADPSGGEPQNFLLVGSDSRSFVEGGSDERAYGTAAEVGPPHADTILLVRTFPALDRVAMVSFPRDLWVPIAGAGEDRINAAVQGGPSQLVRTIAEAYGVDVHHYAEIDFRGFRGIVDAVGGVDVYFPAPVRDYDREHEINPTGLDVRDVGCVRLNGGQALAYVRARHYEQLIGGVWQPDPAGDLDRIQRQQDFIRRTFRATLSTGLLDPGRVDRLLRVAIDRVQLDDGFGVGDALDLGRRFRSLSPDSLRTYVLPTRPGVTDGGAQVLYLDAAGAAPILDVFRGRTDEPAVALPSSVRLRLEDGAARPGQLRASAYRLAAAGFSLAGIGESASRVPRTTIRYGTGQEAAAGLVSARLAGPVVIEADPALVGVDVVLVIGRDWPGVTDRAPAQPALTTTTAAPAPAPAPTTTTPPPAAGRSSC